MLDYSKRKKRYFDMVLHDGAKLRLPMPTKAVFGELNELSKTPEEDIVLDDLIGILEVILNSNKNQAVITAEQLQEFDLEDIKVLFAEYVNFVQKGLSAPN